jgi:uncharacterized membrane protein HdeD (DUF308 family)
MENSMFAVSPWSLVIRGIVAVIFGLFLTMWPGMTVATIVLLFALFAIIDGTVIIIMAIVRGKKDHRWVSYVPFGIVGIIIGLIILLIPEISLLILIYFIAAWALITGFAEFFLGLAAGGVSKVMRWICALSGILSVILGFLMFVYPVSTSVILIWVFGFYLLVFGVYAIISGFWLHSLNKKINSATA